MATERCNSPSKAFQTSPNAPAPKRSTRSKWAILRATGAIRVEERSTRLKQLPQVEQTTSPDSSSGS